jgi:hypothetical protein
MNLKKYHSKEIILISDIKQQKLWILFSAPIESKPIGAAEHFSRDPALRRMPPSHVCQHYWEIKARVSLLDELIKKCIIRLFEKYFLFKHVYIFAGLSD